MFLFIYFVAGGKVFNGSDGLVGEPAERFGARETEKLWFLGK